MSLWEKIKSWFDLNKDNAVTGADLDLAKALAGEKLKDANEAINASLNETKRRVKRAKKEVKDVGAALKEVGNQVGDVVEAATTSKKRPGRKKKTN